MDDWQSQPHRRYNPLTAEWVLVSPHRAQRPWLGERVEPPHERPPQYDPGCYLCPNNARAGGAHNPAYESVYVFENDFAALLPETPETSFERDGLFVAHGERGTCSVVCFSPRHDLHLADLPPAALERVVDCWAEQYAQLAALPFVKAVTAFENRGAMMGASNPHPHGQIWAESSVPSELAKETAGLTAFRRERGGCLLCAYAAAETGGERAIYDAGEVLAVVPFWAVWPFEVLLLPRSHIGSLADLDGGLRAAFARAIGDLTRRYDRLFEAPFPYSMGFHQRPCDGPHDEWHVHAHYYPPLLRSASVRKYSVGYEMLAQQQRDLTPEQAARLLREA